MNHFIFCCSIVLIITFPDYTEAACSIITTTESFSNIIVGNSNRVTIPNNHKTTPELIITSKFPTSEPDSSFSAAIDTTSGFPDTSSESTTFGFSGNIDTTIGLPDTSSESTTFGFSGNIDTTSGLPDPTSETVIITTSDILGVITTGLENRPFTRTRKPFQTGTNVATTATPVDLNSNPSDYKDDYGTFMP
jgi:hypothetical protein